jgi:hypothetical protein
MTENVILVDADYIDSVAFDLTVNFERMLGRRIPKADMPQWIVCVALDGGLKPMADVADGSRTQQETSVVMIHEKATEELNCFAPGTLAALQGQAFSDALGEFAFECHPVEPLTTKADFMLDALQTICRQKEVHRVMVVAAADLYDSVRTTMGRLGEEEMGTKRVTVFTMEPQMGGNFRQEILGYSLMAALGIRSDELREGTAE